MINVLKGISIFEECSRQELEPIAGLCRKATFKLGQRIFEAGNPFEYLCLLSEGEIELRFEVNCLNTSREITLDRKFKGETFGWSALTPPQIPSLSAVAVQDSEVLKVSANDIKRLCQENSHLGYVLMKNVSTIISQRFTTLQRTLIDVIQQHLKEKELRM
ncbi:MAG: Crp/Fnr family transcriptional regulator [bacterium]